MPSKFGHISLLHVFFGETLPDALVGQLWSGHFGPKGSLDRPQLLQVGLRHGFRQLYSASPSPDGRTDHLCVPTAQRSPTRPGGYRWRLGTCTSVWVPPHHYPGQHISATYCAPAKHRANVVCRLLHHPMRCLVGFESGGNHFCLCRAGTTCAFQVLCTSAVPSGLFDRVL